MSHHDEDYDKDYQDKGLFRGQGVQADTKAGQFNSIAGQVIHLNPRNEFQIAPPQEFVVRDSGKRQEFGSGMRRDVDEGKPLFTLLPRDFLRRWAMHMTKAMPKYGRDNWTLANSPEELQRFKDSAFRHFMAWLDGEIDEDHACGVAFNIAAAERVKAKLAGKEHEEV